MHTFYPTKCDPCINLTNQEHREITKLSHDMMHEHDKQMPMNNGLIKHNILLSSTNFSKTIAIIFSLTLFRYITRITTPISISIIYLSAIYLIAIAIKDYVYTKYHYCNNTKSFYTISYSSTTPYNTKGERLVYVHIL